MGESNESPPGVAIRLLGPLRVSVGEAELELVAPMHRGLLAILAVHAGSVVSTEQLIDELWQRTPPAGARATLQSYVSVLRRRFRDLGCPDVIDTRNPGYVLRADAGEIDADRFRSAVAAAQQAAAAGATDECRNHLVRATSLVVGDALDDLHHLDTVRVFAADVAEHHRWAVHELAAIDLARGQAAELIPVLQELTRTQPLEERSWALLMRALHQSGRQADALAAYQRLRTVLVEELGVEPCAEVRAAEAAVLRGDLDLTPDDVARRPTVRAVPPPHPATALIGRGPQRQEIHAAITGHRLVTITGTGGCGKTRLAAEVGRDLVGSFDLVAWAELNSISDGAGVQDAVAGSVGMYRRSADGLDRRVSDHLGDRRVLLVLDNCEHVIDDAAAVASGLMAACDGLTVLATSREPLAVTGERIVTLPPLESASPLELIRSRFDRPSEAAVMFIERAGIDTPTGKDLAVIEAICAQLDGIPLAIELAAPLVQVMNHDEIADRLMDRFLLLADGQRSTRPQHRTLRAVVEWSHELLGGGQRRAFAALSVFRGSFDTDAATAVIGAVGEDAARQLPALVRQSMVLADTSGPSTRYRLLETLRAFGAEQLAADPRAEAAASRAFVTHHADLARRWARQQNTATAGAWLRELGPDLVNLQAAMARARTEDLDSGLAMVDAFQWYFNYVGQLDETRAWLTRALAEADLSAEQRAVATLSLAALATFGGDYGSTATLAEEALISARRLGNSHRVNEALIMRGTSATFEGDAQRAAECFIESAALSEELGDLGGMAASMAFWGIAHRRLGEFDEARDCFDRAFQAFSRLADERGMALVIGNSGRMAHQMGDLTRAAELTRRALEMARRSLDPMVSAQCALFCGHLAFDTGDLAQARADLDAALDHALDLDHRTLSAAALEWLVLVGGADPHDVALIDAFTLVRRNAPGTALPRPEWDAAVVQARRVLDRDTHATLTRRGRAMGLDAAVPHARAAAVAGAGGSRRT